MQLNLPALQAANVATDPFPHMVVPGFLSDASLAEVTRDFPKIDMAGIFPPDELSYGPAFDQLLKTMQGDEMRKLLEQKFGVDLTGRPTMITVRACARSRDGQIHRDSKFKLVTVLLYLNEKWYQDGGRLRTLRSGDDIENYAGEVPPEGGLLFAFQCTPEAWHGHKPFTGPRRYVMMNYVVDADVMNRELSRHRFSAKVKKFKRFFGIGKVKNGF